jgi:ABC-type uncharacterized transport system auxiliary subunit
MRYLLTIFLISFTLLSCTQEEERPTDVLEFAKMVELVVDVEKVEAHLRTLNPEASLVIETKERYGMLLTKHGITQEEFKKSYNWWRAHPEQFENIYELALAQLKSEEAELKKR